MKRFIGLALTLFTFVVAAQDDEIPPAPGQPRDFTMPARETVQLANGLSLTFIDYGTVPLVTVFAVVRTGNIDEGESTWLADVAVEMFKEGTTTRSAADIARSAAGMGGSLSVGAGAEQTSIGISALSEHAAAAADLVADVLRNPRFPESELPRVLANFERSLSIARSEPDSMAAEALARLVYGNHPFGHVLPAPGQLERYDIAAVRGFYERNFGARRTHVYVAGRYDRVALEAALRRAFGDWREGAAPSDLPPKVSDRLQLQLIDRPGAPQSSLRMAVAVPNPAAELYFPTTLTNSLLGGTFSSRITTNLREDKGYSYSPDSSISARRGNALWVMSAEITAEHTSEALTEIFREIERLQHEPPAAEELDAIKRYRAGIFVIGNSSPNGVLGQLAFMDLHGLPPEFLTHWVANMYAVTPQQVTDIARRYILPARMTIVVVGDLKAFGDSVRALPQLQGVSMP